MALSRIFTIPKPQSFLFCIPLRSAVELIIFILLINKITGLYGILALFTGYDLGFSQLSYYTYSLASLVLVAYLSLATSTKKNQAPLQNVALAWIYVMDTAINTIYTAFFIASWFAVLASHLGQEPSIKLPGTGMIEDTAGFTSPEVDASHVEISAKPSDGILPAQDATVVASTNGNDQPALLRSGGLMSLFIIVIFFIIRIYFCLIVLSHARNMLRQYIVTSSTSYTQSADTTLAENPFRTGREEGEGWRGRLGRFMLRFPSQRYWLGMDDADVRSKESVRERKSVRPHIPITDMNRSAVKELRV